MSVLRPETLAVLRDVRARDPLFKAGTAADFDARFYVSEDVQVLPRTDGTFAVYDAHVEPWSARVVSVHPTPQAALKDARARLVGAAP